MNKTADPYSSRTSDSWEITPRVDPTASDAAGPLTTDEVWNYASDGFLFAPNLFSGDEVTKLLEEANSLSEAWPEDRPGIIFEPQSRRVRSLFRLHHFSKLYERFLSEERLLSRVKQLLGTDVYLHQSRVNYKSAMHGGEFFWHSDFETWHVEDGMPRMRALSVSIFLTESNEFNGPLMLIPGSHLNFIRCSQIQSESSTDPFRSPDEYVVPPRSAISKLLEDREIAAPKGPAGSVVFFDCNTMHGSNGNLSANGRANLFAVYNSVENALVEPYGNRQPRPDYLAERTAITL